MVVPVTKQCLASDGDSCAVQITRYGGVDTVANTTNKGVTWTDRTLPTGDRFTWVMWDGTQFVMVGEYWTGSNDVIAVATSPNGTTWTDKNTIATTGGTTHVEQVIKISGMYLVFPQSDSSSFDYYYTSPDLITWTRRSMPVSMWVVNAIAVT